MSGLAGMLAVLGVIVVSILVGVIVIPNWMERRAQAKMSPEERARRQRYNNIMEWPRNHYNATLELQDEVVDLKARLADLEAKLAEREPRLTR